MTVPIPDWHTSLDVIYAAAIGTREPQPTGIGRTVDETTGETLAIHATIPDPRYSWVRSHWILFDLTCAPDGTPGHFRIQSWAVRMTDDSGLTDLALMAARFEEPVTDTILTPTLRPANRAKPGAMTETHAAHRVWQLAAQRAASAALTGFPLTRELPGIHLNQATHHSRLKANGVLDGKPFRFETTNSGTAYLRFGNPDGSIAEEYGPLHLMDAGLTGSEPSDTQLSTLITALRTMPANPRLDGNPRQMTTSFYTPQATNHD